MTFDEQNRQSLRCNGPNGVRPKRNLGGSGLESGLDALAKARKGENTKEDGKGTVEAATT